MKITDLTVEQFRELVAEIVDQKLDEKLGMTAATGQSSVSTKPTRASKVTLEQVCKEFGLILKE